ncbi:MAG: sugar phosphate isomerase/epimerase [Planctomycetales bacterium]|nr:sugar phosphate isomerase/epimerase [Planctomycetales bacterium]
MKPTLSQVCSLHSTFAQDVEDYAAGHCKYLEIWLTKLEQFVASHSVEAAQRLLAEHHMAAPVASFQGGLLTSQGEKRSEAWSLFTRRLELLRELSIGTVVVACDVVQPLDQASIDRTRHSLEQIAVETGRRGLRAALEFQARSAFGNNLQTAVALVAEVGSPHLGICLDWFHFYLGPSQFADLELLSSSNLFHVQVADLADVPREFATDSDRIMPGDGDMLMAPLLERLRAIDYQGCVSLELMNPQIWEVPPRQFGEIGITSLRRVLGQASMQDGGGSNIEC